MPFDTRVNPIAPVETGLDPRELHRMAGIYTVLELACALKPHIVRHALDLGAGPVVYLDSDVQVFAPLDELAEQARSAGVVVTPHLLSPPQRDPHGVDIETVVLQSGVFNMGIFAVGPEGRGLLEDLRWADRLARDCIVAPAEARSRPTSVGWISRRTTSRRSRRTTPA